MSRWNCQRCAAGNDADTWVCANCAMVRAFDRDDAPPADPAQGSEPVGQQPVPGDRTSVATAPVVQYNVMAIGALIASVTGFWPVGLVLAIVALVQIARTGQAGRGLAVAALVISVLWLVFFSGFALFTLQVFDEIGTSG